MGDDDRRAAALRELRQLFFHELPGFSVDDEDRRRARLKRRRERLKRRLLEMPPHQRRKALELAHARTPAKSGLGEKTEAVAVVAHPATSQDHSNPLDAVLAAAHADKLSDDEFVALCGGLERMRDAAAHYAIDREEGLELQQEAAQHRARAGMLDEVIGSLTIAGDPPTARPRVLDRLMTMIEGDSFAAAIEAVEAIEDDERRLAASKNMTRRIEAIAHERLRQLVGWRETLLAIAASTDAELTYARPPVLLTVLMPHIVSAWVALGHRPTMTVDPLTQAVSSPFVDFALACCRLFGLNNISAEAIRAAERRCRVNGHNMAEKSGACSH
jgi:hypothetical protein